MRNSTDSYFVRFGGDPHVGQGSDGPIAGRSGLGAQGPVRHRRRRRGKGKIVFVTIVVFALGTWVAWAAQRPGGVYGTAHGWVQHVRGDVANVSNDPDLGTARRYFNGQYTATGSYPNLSESDLAAVGIGVGVNVEWCNSQAVVIQGASGGGTSSRLLLSGHDLGEIKGKYDCPTSFTNPSPWKAP